VRNEEDGITAKGRVDYKRGKKKGTGVGGRVEWRGGSWWAGDKRRVRRGKRSSEGAGGWGQDKARGGEEWGGKRKKPKRDWGGSSRGSGAGEGSGGGWRGGESGGDSGGGWVIERGGATYTGRGARG